MCLKVVILLMSLADSVQKKQIVVEETIKIYTPPAIQPVKKRKIFFIAGSDPDKNVQ